MADDPALDAPVALKVLGDNHSTVPEIRERFVNEARTLRRLASDRIVAVFDIGEWQGQPYVVMEALVGGTLEERMAGRDPSTRDLQRLVAELAACLTAAHTGGVVHRDIKPSNLLLRKAPGRTDPGWKADSEARDGGALVGWDERLVLADFGLARTLGLTGITIAGGTDEFMAPEQRVPSAAVDERADIYAATAVVALAAQRKDGDQQFVRPGTEGDALDRALARGMATDPDDRFSDADHWARELTAALGTRSQDQAPSPGGTSSAAAEGEGMTADQQRSRQRSVALLSLTVAMVVGVIAIAFLLAGRNGDQSTTSTGSSEDASSEDTALEPAGTDTNTGETAAVFDGGWTVRDSAIVDPIGVPVEIRGINWFGFQSERSVVDGLWARNWRELIDLIADLQFNTIRLPYAAAILEPGTSPVGIDTELNPELAGLTSIEVMDLIIDYAGANGLAVILARHPLEPEDESPLWYNDTYPAERFMSDWELLADRYRNNPNVVGAELGVGPQGEACWGCGDPNRDWLLAAEQAGDAIHERAPNWLIFVSGVEQVDGQACDQTATPCPWPGANLSQAPTNPVQLTVAADPKVVYAPKDLGSSVAPQDWLQDPSFPDNMPAEWDRWWGQLEADEVAPVVVSAVGAKLGSGSAAEVDRVWLERLLRYLDERDADFVFSALNPSTENADGLLADDWTTVDEEKMDLLRPYLTGPFE